MSTINEILEENLDPTQCQAAMDSSKEILTLACAGSGKSRTLAFRIARLLVEGIEPSSIVAFTFTEKAAESIKLRVSEALAATEISPTILGAMYIGTIHSYCQNVLGEMDANYRQFDVLDDNRLKLYLISRYARLGLQQIRSARNARYFEVIKEVSNAWSIANDEMIDIQTIVLSDPELGNSLINFRQLLQQEQFIDFSMMIRLVAEGLANNNPAALRAVSNLKHLMVDEYQDVNPAQELLIRELHRLSDTLFVVGDDDQSIYGWRGADVRNILTFTQRYPRSSVHTLATNYRSTQAIVEVSDRFIAAELGPNRFPKNPVASSNETPRDFRNLWFNAREDEAEWVIGRIQRLLGIEYREKKGATRGLTYSDFAILMRSTRSGDPARHTDFTQRLTNAGVPYSLESGGSVFDRPQVSILRESYELLREESPNRQQAQQFYNARVLPNFPDADFNRFANVLSSWGRQIHAPISGARRKVYPQQLVHDLLNAFGIEQTNFDSGIMQDIGLFSRIMQDVETVYLSIDTAARYQDILNFLANIAESGYDTSTDDVLRRPDAVTVSTVHKLKGLEFPVVFIVDAEASRFPSTNRGYQGWLPANVIQTALNRNAYRGNPEEEARLFYTALTRAERFLSVSGSERLPNGVKRWKVSPFSLRLNHPEISTELTDTNNYQRATPKQRIDETV